MKDKHRTELSEKKDVEPLPIDSEYELLDWDAFIPPPLPKRRATLRVQLHYNGRAKPLSVANAEEE